MMNQCNQKEQAGVQCDLNWLLPFIFGWPGLKFTVTHSNMMLW